MDDDEEDVLSAREIEVEVRLRRVQVGTLETVQRNSELLKKLSDLHDKLSLSDSTVTDLERNLQVIRSESLRLEGLMEQSLLMSQNLQFCGTEEVKSLEKEMWLLERECRLLSSPSIRTRSRSASPVPGTRLPPVVAAQVPMDTTDIRDELLSTKEELALLKRQIQQITRSSPPPMQTSPLPLPSHHSRQSTAEHHHHHYYYHPTQIPEFSRELAFHRPNSRKGPDTPVHARFFNELPTPPMTARSVSTNTLSSETRHERFSSLSAWDREMDSPGIIESPPGLQRTFSHESIVTTSSNPTFFNSLATPVLKRSSSHDSIFDPPASSTAQTCTPHSISRCSSPRPSPRSSPLHSAVSATSSATYFSASASLRQNTTSSLLLLSSTRGKHHSRGLSSRKSFWNLWDRTDSRGGQGRRGRSGNSPLGLGERVVVCTEVDVGMLRDALEEVC